MKIIDISTNKEGQEERFWELLYDERIAEDTFWVPKEAFFEVGGINSKIKAKQQYEFLLRLADSYCVEFSENPFDQAFADRYVKVEYRETGCLSDEIYTDCYIISKYKDKLIAAGCFDEVLKSVLGAANRCGLQNETVDFLEKMLKREKEFYEIDDAIRPVLIYKGENICHNILNVFAEQFGEALMRAGQAVEYFDSEKEDVKSMTKFIGKRYRAVVGMQTYLFGLKIQNGQMFLHDKIYAPKFNFVFDHPIWMKNHFTQSPQNLSIFTLDQNYQKFIKQYYNRRAYLFPPAGVLPDSGVYEKKYDVSFVGTYGDFWNELLMIHGMERRFRFLANKFLLIMRKQPDLPAEAAFGKALEQYGISCTKEEFLELFYQMRRVTYCVMHYFRYQVMLELLAAGIRVDVFGNSWNYCPLSRYPNLVCHPDVTMEESMKIWRQSKLSLNVMSWHKSGFTERMANIMLCRSVLITDETAYLDGRFCDGEDLLSFRLCERAQLPKRIRAYLNDPEEMVRIADNGYQKAKQHHTWDGRAKEFLEKILEEGLCGTE